MPNRSSNSAAASWSVKRNSRERTSMISPRARQRAGEPGGGGHRRFAAAGDREPESWGEPVDEESQRPVYGRVVYDVQVVQHEHDVARQLRRLAAEQRNHDVEAARG